MGVLGTSFEEIAHICHSSETGADAIFSCVSSLNRGECSPLVANLLGCARLVCITKPAGGVRPISICDCLTRLAGSVAMRQIRPLAPTYFTSSADEDALRAAEAADGPTSQLSPLHHTTSPPSRGRR